MIDAFTPEERSRIMSRIRSRGNAATELRFVEILRTYRIRGWRRGTTLPGRPDFVFQKERVAVFVDGDFWHGNPRKFRLPKSNLSYWGKKIFSNRARDSRVNKTLRKSGWVVVRFWQTSLRDENLVVERLQRYLNRNSHVSEKRNDNLTWTDSKIESAPMVADEPSPYTSKNDKVRRDRRKDIRTEPR